MDALDDIRREEQRTAASKKEIFLGRRLFMIPKAGMTCEQAEKHKPSAKGLLRLLGGWSHRSW